MIRLSLLVTCVSLLACGTPATSDLPVDPLPLDLPDTPFNYAEPDLPAHLSVESEGFHGQRPLLDDDNTRDDNPTTDAGATLGRVLYYDTNLSQNGTISCASCHRAELGFSDDAVLSVGFDEGTTGRHSMASRTRGSTDPGGSSGTSGPPRWRTRC